MEAIEKNLDFFQNGDQATLKKAGIPSNKGEVLSERTVNNQSKVKRLAGDFHLQKPSNA